MTKQWLFSGPRWNAFWPALRAKALTAVRNVDLHALQTATDLQVETIARVHEIAVANLRPISHGMTRLVSQEQKSVGGRRAAKVTMLDVFVPFQGGNESFRLQPSRGESICVEHELTHQHLILTVPYDANAEQAIDDLMKRVSENLDKLRTEVVTSGIVLRDAIRVAATVRLERESLPNRSLSFAIRSSSAPSRGQRF